MELFPVIFILTFAVIWWENQVLLFARLPCLQFCDKNFATTLTRNIWKYFICRNRPIGVIITVYIISTPPLPPSQGWLGSCNLTLTQPQKRRGAGYHSTLLEKSAKIPRFLLILAGINLFRELLLKIKWKFKYFYNLVLHKLKL